MKHNGIANLFLGFIYGGSFTYVHAFVDEMPLKLILMSVLFVVEWLLTCFLYDALED